MLTDYHLHLRPDDDGTAADALHRGERRPLPGRRREAGIAELGVSEHVYRFRQALELWQPPVLGEPGARRPRRLLRVRAHDAAAARDRGRLRPRRRGPHRERCSRPATSTTWSARSTSSATPAPWTTARYDVWETIGDPDELWRRYFEWIAEVARSGLFDILAHPDLVKVWGDARPLPERDPRPTTSPRSRRSPRAGSRSRSRPPACASRSARSTRSRAFAEMCVEAGAAFALSSDAHAPEQVGFGYDAALEFLAELGVERDLRLRGPRARGLRAARPSRRGRAGGSS